MVGSIYDHLVIVIDGAHPETLDGHLHVRLSGTYPHLSSDNIVDGQRLTVVEGDAQRLVTGLWRLDFHEPLAVLAGLRCYCLVAPGGCYLNGLAWCCPSPETGISLLLEHHVVADDMRQSYLGLSMRWLQERAESSESFSF